MVRKAYGAGLYAMAGPGFEPDATIALPTAKIAVMGAEAAVNAVYANKIAAIADEDERAAFVAAKRAEYERDIDIVRLASELVVDADRRAGRAARRADPPVRRGPGKDRHFSRRRHGVTPSEPRASVLRGSSTSDAQRGARGAAPDRRASSPTRWSRR